jgi:hypothetical protein
VSEPLPTLAEALDQLAATSAGFDRVFRTIDYAWTEGAPLRGKFVYPAFTAGAVDVDAVVDFLDRCLVDYCIPRSEIAALSPPSKQLSRDELQQLRENLSAQKDRARRLFISARKELKTGGEAGELILYTLLERLLKAPQLVSKMNLKTNSNQPVFGRDGVHVTVDLDDSSLLLLLGESKMEQQFSKAADHALESVVTYLGDLSLRQHEIDVMRSHADLSGLSPKAQEQLKQLLNPYGGGPPAAGIVHACLLAFEAAEYNKVLQLRPVEVEAAFKVAYLERVRSGCALIKEKVTNDVPVGVRFIFILLPLPSLETFRRVFLEKLGLKREG